MAKKEPTIPRLALGSALILLGILLFFGRKQSQIPQSTTFENEPVKVELLQNGEVGESKIPKRIVVPNISIDLVVKKAKIINGYWEVFTDTAGWGEGSGVPGEKGNQVIFAHAREGLFKPLQFIKVDDRIYIFTNSVWYSYKVQDIKEVYPNQTEVIAPTEDEILTLYRCSGYADTKRLIVIARRT